MNAGGTANQTVFAASSSTNQMIHILYNNGISFVYALNSSGSWQSVYSHKFVQHKRVYSSRLCVQRHLDCNVQKRQRPIQYLQLPLESTNADNCENGRDHNNSNDNGPESLRFFRYYDRSLTDEEVTTLYNAHVQNDLREHITTYRANKARCTAR